MKFHIKKIRVEDGCWLRARYFESFRFATTNNRDALQVTFSYEFLARSVQNYYLSIYQESITKYEFVLRLTWKRNIRTQNMMLYLIVSHTSCEGYVDAEQDFLVIIFWGGWDHDFRMKPSQSLGWKSLALCKCCPRINIEELWVNLLICALSKNIGVTNCRIVFSKANEIPMYISLVRRSSPSSHRYVRRLKITQVKRLICSIIIYQYCCFAYLQSCAFSFSQWFSWLIFT